MISIQTNLSSIILQQNLANATKVMNQALERMSTGYRINRASDNPAGYAIVTDMTTKLNAYYVAEDNVASGIDFIATANDIISLMQDKASKLYSLSTQARNGTYGASSLASINSEANAIMAEINRLYMTTQYNGIDLFSQKAYTIASHLPQAGSSGFIDESAVTTMPEAVRTISVSTVCRCM